MRAVVVITADDARREPQAGGGPYLVARFHALGIEISGLHDPRLIFDSLDDAAAELEYSPASTVAFRVTFDDRLPLTPLLVWVRPRGRKADPAELVAVSLLAPPNPSGTPRYCSVLPMRAGRHRGRWLAFDAVNVNGEPNGRLNDTVEQAKTWCEGCERRRLLAVSDDRSSSLDERAAVIGSDARTRAG